MSKTDGKRDNQTKNRKDGKMDNQKDSEMDKQTDSRMDNNQTTQPPKREIDRRRMAGPSRVLRKSRGWNIGYFLREGFVGIFRHGLMSFAAIGMIVACLLIMGTFSLVAVNLDVNLQALQAKNEFSAYVDDSYTLEQAQALQERILALDNIREADFVDRETVLEEFQTKRQGENELFDLLPDDTFQHRYQIRVNDISRLQETVDAVGRVEGISETSAGIEVAEGMIAMRNVAMGVAVILMAVLVVVSLFIIASTLRLATFYRRDEIAIMKMCGATNGFVRWPFIVEGALLGLFAALVAFGVQWWLYSLIADAMAAGGQLGFLVVMAFESLWKYVLAVFCGAGLVIGILGSLLAIRKFLHV